MSSMAERIEREQAASMTRPFWKRAPIPEQAALRTKMEAVAQKRLASLRAELLVLATPKAKPGQREATP